MFCIGYNKITTCDSFSICGKRGMTFDVRHWASTIKIVFNNYNVRFSMVIIFTNLLLFAQIAKIKPPPK